VSVAQYELLELDADTAWCASQGSPAFGPSSRWTMVSEENGRYATVRARCRNRRIALLRRTSLPLRATVQFKQAEQAEQLVRAGKPTRRFGVPATDLRAPLLRSVLQCPVLALRARCTVIFASLMVASDCSVERRSDTPESMDGRVGWRLGISAYRRAGRPGQDFGALPRIV